MMLFVPVFMRAVMLLLKNFSSYGILCCETLLECLFCTIHDLEKTEKTNKTILFFSGSHGRISQKLA